MEISVTKEATQQESEFASTLPISHTPVSEESLVLIWKLTPDELQFVMDSSTREYQTWFAYCYLMLKKSGTFSTFTERVPFAVQAFINTQFSLLPETPFPLPLHEATRSRARLRMVKKLRLEELDDEVKQDLTEWMVERSAEGQDWSLIRDQLVPLFKSWRVLIPAESSLQRLVQSCWNEAEKNLFSLIFSKIPHEKKVFLENFLKRTNNKKTSEFFSLKEFPKKIRPEIILEYIDKANILDDAHLNEIDLTCVSPAVVNAMARSARIYDVSQLRRFPSEKRLALLVCFILESQGRILDQIVQMHDVYLTGLERRSRNSFEQSYKKSRRKSKAALKTITQASRLLLDFEGKALAKKVSSNLNKHELTSALNEIETLSRLDERGFLDEVILRHNHLKRYLDLFLALPFQSEKGSIELLFAIECFLEIAISEKKLLHENAPVFFIRPAWRNFFDKGNAKERLKIWELSLAFEVRAKLRSLDLFLPQSRNHRSFWKMVEPDGVWKKRRTEAYSEMSIPKLFTDLERQLKKDFDLAFKEFQAGLSKNEFVEVSKDGVLKVHKEGPVSHAKELEELAEALKAELPKHVPIETILLEVERLTQFASKLRPQTDLRRSPDEERTLVLAAILAHGTNIGLTGMASATSGVTLDALLETTRSRLTPENLSAANDTLVNFHLKHPFSKLFESASISSSDGQRFPIQEKSLISDLCTRYYGFYKNAINVYTHISGNSSVFSTQIFPCGLREAFSVISGLFETNSEFRSEIHTTDTHGYTDALFAILHLLGIQFAPRLKDLSDARLFAYHGFESDEPLSKIFERSKISLQECAPHWDDMVRVVSALRSGQVSAHTILPKIFAGSNSDKLSQSFKKLGQLIKTTFLLRYFHRPELRSLIRQQLNRGEHRHSLARQIFFSNKGEFRTGDLDQLISKSSCLSIICNAILIWNTVRYEKIINTLEARDSSFNMALFKHISPVSWEHIRINGRYDFHSSFADEEGFA